MACCVAIAYLFGLAWLGIRWCGRALGRLVGSRPEPAPQFAPPARREVSSVSSR